jgi:hypothetical protein
MSPPPLADVAIMSFRKPESLAYTLLTLHRHSAPHIGTVWITDDGSGDDTLARLADPELARLLSPWKLDLAANRRRVGWALTQVTPRHLLRLAHPLLPWGHRLRSLYGVAKAGFSRPEDIRYQRALEQTKASLMLLLHDDVQVTGDVAEHLIASMQADPKLAVAGQLGQCWRCGHRTEGCTPHQVLDGHRPSPQWPVTRPPEGMKWRLRDRACRINEWCAMLRVQVARDLGRKGIYFGTKEDGGDTGAFWFGAAVKAGWHFVDPFAGTDANRLFRHGWQGHSGHSVWRDQGAGRAAYDVEEIRRRLRDEFGYAMP